MYFSIGYYLIQKSLQASTSKANEEPILDILSDDEENELFDCIDDPKTTKTSSHNVNCQNKQPMRAHDDKKKEPGKYYYIILLKLYNWKCLSKYFYFHALIAVLNKRQASFDAKKNLDGNNLLTFREHGLKFLL